MSKSTTAVPSEGDPGARRDQRQAPRYRYLGVIFLSWIEPDGENHVMGRCLDISEGGLGVEIRRRVAVGTEVRVRADWVKLDGAATVRHLIGRNGAFHIGLQLKQPLSTESLAQLKITL
jgi:hypothetical protein